MKISTLVNQIPKSNGFHIWDNEDNRFLTNREFTEIVNSFWNDKYSGGYLDQASEEEIDYVKNAPFKEKLEMFKEEYESGYLKEYYTMIELPLRGFGLYLDGDRYVNELKRVMNL